MVKFTVKILTICYLILSIHSVSADTKFEVSLGLNYFLQSQSEANFLVSIEDSTDIGLQIGAKIRSPFTQNKLHFIGTGLDIANIEGQRLLGFRALDYQWQFDEQYRLGLFFGAASLDTGAPQNGYYYGFSMTMTNFYENLTINLEMSRADGLARDRIVSDPAGTEVDIFLDVFMSSINVAWQFF